MALRSGRKVWMTAAAAATVAAAAAVASSTVDAAGIGGSAGTWASALLPSRRTLAPRYVTRTFTLRRLVCPAGTHTDDGYESCDDTDDEHEGGGTAPRADNRGRHPSTGACAASVGFRSVASRAGWNGGLSVAHAAMVEDEAACTGDGRLVLVPPAALESLETLAKALGDDADDTAVARPLAVAVDARLGAAVDDAFDGDDALIGVDGAGRSCGRRRSAPAVVTIFVMPRAPVDTTFLGRRVVLPAAPALLRVRLPSRDDNDDDDHTNGEPHGPDGGRFHDAPLCVYTTATAGEPGGGSNSTAGGGGGSSCFPAAATVELASGRTVAMADLAVGDVVRVAAGDGAAAFSPVYLFSHRSPGGVHPVVTMTTASGRTLTASPDHLIPVGGGGGGRRRVLLRAADVAVGDALTDAHDRVSSRVVRVGRATAAGLYNPHTVAGDIVVGGVLASTWTAAVPPRLAAAALAPAAAVGAATGYRLDPSGGLLEGGGGALGRWLIRAVARLSA
ncbi:hypothetical protein I4F81_006961 [Pyropia yezoensis]|uniref:Uncharacterized protein n=1 Tax=Pyropia yezoensis TaxID=2788 RepID=A0ACC3C2T1_PYRYE|nr:hypothetical protein I4F81_006961 [Neopyropia yezoensis]